MRRTFAALILCLSAVGITLPVHAEPSETLEKIRATGEVTLGYREASIPLSYLGTDQKPIGYAIELCGRVVDTVKAELQLPDLQVRYKDVTSENRIPLLQDGVIDIECGSTTSSMVRRDLVGFSVSYFIASVRMLVRKDSGVKDLSDLDGMNVAITSGTTANRVFQEKEKQESIQVHKLYAMDHDEAFRWVESGQAQAFVLDDVLLAGLLAVSSNPALAIVGPSLNDEPYGLMLRKGDRLFKQLVDRTLIGLMKSGEAEKLYTRWFQREIPPPGITLNSPKLPPNKINLNLPMSPALQKAFDNPIEPGGRQASPP